MNLPEGYEKSLCEIKSAQNDLLVVAWVASVGDDYIQFSNAPDFMPIIQYGTVLKLIILNSKLGTQFLVGRVYLSTKKFLRVTELSQITAYEKRKYFRLNVDMPAQLYVEEGEKQRAYVVHVRDLSLGGLQFDSELWFDMNEEMEICFNLEGKRVICKLVVRRIDDESKAMVYGCEFQKLSNEVSRLLCAYLFKKQVEQKHERERKASF